MTFDKIHHTSSPANTDCLSHGHLRVCPCRSRLELLICQSPMTQNHGIPQISHMKFTKSFRRNHHITNDPKQLPLSTLSWLVVEPTLLQKTEVNWDDCFQYMYVYIYIYIWQNKKMFRTTSQLVTTGFESCGCDMCDHACSQTASPRGAPLRA